jgi:hypothetical protein
VSLLLSCGHRDAYHYPLGRVFDETNLVVERENSRLSVEALLAQHAHGAIHSKKGGSAFQKLLKKLTFTTEPIKGLLENRR